MKKKKQREKNWSDDEGSGDDAGLVEEDSEVVRVLLTSILWCLVVGFPGRQDPSHTTSIRFLQVEQP